MAQLFSNNALTLSPTPITTDDMQISLKPGSGVLFPTLPIGQVEDFFLITLENQTATQREIVSIIAREGDVLYVGARGLEGTEIQNWPERTIIELRLTAGTMEATNSALGVIADLTQASNAFQNQIANNTEQTLNSLSSLDARLLTQTYAINGVANVGNATRELTQEILLVLQQQLEELQTPDSGGVANLNTEQLEAILQTLILLNQKPSPRLDPTNRVVIDASETLVSLNTTTALTVNSTAVGTTVGSTTVVFDPFSNPSVFYSNVKVS